MGNSIALFEKYINKLDEVYAMEAKTAVLDGNNELVRAGSNTHTIQVPKMTMDGLADYSRTSGYVLGDVSIEYEDVAFNYDRGRKFSVDIMDDEETAGVAFGQLAAQFIRDKVVKEMDAVRFAAYAGTQGISTVAAAALDTADTWLAALTVAKTTMDDDEVSEESRYLFISPTGRNLIEGMDTYKSRAMIDSFAQVITVPQARFNTSVELLDGTTVGETNGGFKVEGNDINFLIIDKGAVMQYTKHTVNKVIGPEANQSSDGYLFFYRAYALHQVLENKLGGVYLHKSTVTRGGSN